MNFSPYSENDEKSRGKEFSTELKFTAVGVEANFDKTIERNSSRSESESDDYVIDDNWVFPGGRQSLALKVSACKSNYSSGE